MDDDLSGYWFRRLRFLTASLFVASCFAQNAPPAVPPSTLRHLPLVFEPNRGQSTQGVRFLARQGRREIALLEREVVVASKGVPKLRIRPVGSSAPRAMEGVAPTSGVSNYFIGSPDHWRTEIPNFERVKYRGIYPGIDWVFRGNQQDVEYDFIVAPGADPSRINLEFSGASQLLIDRNGDLAISGPDVAMVQGKPFLYQMSDGIQEVVEGEYALLGHNKVGLRVGPYDRSRELVIDPVLTYSALIGGSGVETALAIAVDPMGNAYVTGNTNSVGNFPGVGYRNGSNEQSWAYVYKMNPSGSAILYSALIGGSSSANSTGTGIAVDALGNAYVAGTTTAPDFPTTANAFQGGFPAQQAALHSFVLSLNPAGSALTYSTYLRGTYFDFATGLALDSTGNAYVSGYTTSPNFPVTTGAYQTSLPSTTSAFLTKVNPTGTGLAYSTFLGGPGSSFDTQANAVAVDSLGNAYLTGWTKSSSFPITPGAFETATVDAGQYGFVTKFNPTGTALIYSTVISGGGISPNGIAVDSLGNAYVAGGGSYFNYPGLVTIGTPSAPDVFALKLNPAGSSASYMTRLAASNDDHALAIAVDGSGNAYVAGYSNSTDFPQVSPVQGMGAPGVGSSAAIAVKLDGTGTPVFSTYLGGHSNGDWATGVAVDGNGTAYLAGRAGSMDFPVTPGAAGKTVGDGFDTFVAAISSSSSCAFTLSPLQASFPAAGGQDHVDVSAPAGCNWISSSNTPWITLVAPASGNGPGSQSYTVQPNLTPARSANISVAGKLFNVSQANGCTYSLGAPGVNVTASGAVFSLSLNTGLGCTWTLSTPPSWIQIAAGPHDSGAGILITVSANTGAARSTTLTIAGLPFVINQDGGFTCSFSITPASRSYTRFGSSDSFQMNTISTCPWTAASDSSWLHVTDVASALGDYPIDGQGSGHVNLSFDQNNGGVRSGTITAGGLSFSVTQAGVAPPSKIGIYRSGLWQMDANGTGIFESGPDKSFFLGFPGATQFVGDWNGDGRSKAGVYSNGYWFLDYDGNGVWDGGVVDKLIPWGWAGVTPIVGDWNGDGKTKIGVYSNGFWFLDYNGDYLWDGGVVDKQIGWGWAGTTPIVGDWNGNGKTKIGVYIDGFWFLDYDGNYLWDGGVVDKQVGWGWAGVTPIVGDWNGDGKTKIGVYSGGYWYLDYDGNYLWEYPAKDQVWSLGWPGTTPVMGDWNGDGRTKGGAFINGFWYLDYDGNGTFTPTSGTDRIFAFGAAGDIPVVGRW